MIKEELKKKYDGKLIDVLETQAGECRLLSRKNDREFIEILYYLKVTNRYKENKRYCKETFYSYIKDRFSLLKGTFEEKRKVYGDYPDEAGIYGPGLVAKTLKVCGSQNVKEVFTQICKAEENRKTPLSRERIDSIIEQNRTEIKKEIKDWRAMYLAEVAAHEKTKVYLQEAMKKVKLLEGQIERLKKTAESFSVIRKTVEAHYQQPAQGFMQAK